MTRPEQVWPKFLERMLGSDSDGEGAMTQTQSPRAASDHGQEPVPQRDVGPEHDTRTGRNGPP